MMNVQSLMFKVESWRIWFEMPEGNFERWTLNFKLLSESLVDL